MRPTVYVETTVISYLTSRPSRDLIVAAHQQLIHDWWNNHRLQFELFVSPTVMEEISKGDPGVATSRLEAVAGLAVLELTPDLRGLADEYFANIQLPERARADSYHLAFASWHGMDYLITWNCSHMASGFVRKQVAKINKAWGIESPAICTPEELMEVPDVQGSNR